MQLRSFVKGCFPRRCRCCCWRRKRTRWDEREKTSPTSHSNSEKCQLRLSSLLSVRPHSSAPPSFVDEIQKWMKKAILNEQILDIPCRSILIRSSKNVSWIICSCFNLSVALYSFTHDDYPPSLLLSFSLDDDSDEGTNAKLSCCWLIINFILILSSPLECFLSINATNEYKIWQNLS